VTRCLFSAVGMLSADHQPETLNLLINSGLLALTQTVLRLCGLYTLAIHDDHNYHNIDHLCQHSCIISQPDVVLTYDFTGCILALCNSLFVGFFMPSKFSWTIEQFSYDRNLTLKNRRCTIASTRIASFGMASCYHFC